MLWASSGISPSRIAGNRRQYEFNRRGSSSIKRALGDPAWPSFSDYASNTNPICITQSGRQLPSDDYLLVSGHPCASDAAFRGGQFTVPPYILSALPPNRLK